MTKKLMEEHDQRRIEQQEVQQRLESAERSGKSDIAELFQRVKRYEDEARMDNDEVRQGVSRIASSLEERALRDKKELRDILEHEASDLSRRMDKCNIERLNDCADIQEKMCLLGRSASRHLETLNRSLNRSQSRKHYQRITTLCFQEHHQYAGTDGQMWRSDVLCLQRLRPHLH